MGYWGVVNNCIKNSDLILLIIDARVVGETINKEVIRKAEEKDKEIVYVFNKSDLIGEKEINELRNKFKNSFFVSAKSKRGIKRLKEYLVNRSESSEKSIRVSLIGYPNVGKSSILNIIAPQAKAKVSSVSGTTKKTQWIRQGNIRFMDSPGVISRRDSNVIIGISASKDPHKVRDPEKVAIKIINLIKRKNKRIIEKFYGVLLGVEDSDYDIFLKIGSARNFLVKGGEVDEHRTAVKIMDDWQKGKIALK
jgi:ribosome biogenesis GTPase A